MVYYSATGNTKSVAEMFPGDRFDIFNVKDFDIDDFNKYQVIVLGMSTWQRGMPPKIFQKITPCLTELKNKDFYLFGSGRIEYEYYCGALDLFNEILNRENKVHEILKFEGYPTENKIKEAKIFIEKIKIN